MSEELSTAIERADAAEAALDVARAAAVALPTVEEVKARIERVKEIRDAIMTPGEDYGTVGDSDKPGLFKSGAEILCMGFSLTPQIPTTEEILAAAIIGPDYVEYTVKVTLIDRATQRIVAEGIGVCNTQEAKYADRRRFVPEWKLTDAEKDRAIGEVEKEKRNGEPYIAYVFEGDPRDLCNTAIKMAKKRGLVDAALTATCSSGLFAQDVEDMPGDAAGADAPKSGARGRQGRPSMRGASGAGQTAGSGPAAAESPPGAKTTNGDAEAAKFLDAVFAGLGGHRSDFNAACKALDVNVVVMAREAMEAGIKNDDAAGLVAFAQAKRDGAATEERKEDLGLADHTPGTTSRDEGGTV